MQTGGASIAETACRSSVIRRGMTFESSGTVEAVTVDELDQARADLIAALHQRFGEREKAFLMSFKRGDPSWDLLGVAHAADLPAVRWKLQNLAQMSADKHREALDNLERVFGNI